MGRNRQMMAVALLAGAVVVGACSEPAPDEDATDTTTTGAGTGSDVIREGDTIVEQFAGEDWFLGTVPDAPVAADPGAEPVVIGMINQEDTPIGSFPEIRRAVEAGVEFVNTELGGVGGRPLELHTCITSFDPEQSASCAQEMVALDVVALVGGIDVTSNGSIPVLEANGIPQLGGIPANLVEQQSDVTFFFSGGVTGGLAAFLAHTAEEGGTDAVLAYGEFESFQVAVEDYAVPVADLLGVETEIISFPLTATDFLPVLTRSAESDPDAIIVAAAGSACAPIMQTYQDLGIEAQLYLVGACADGEIIRAADGAEAGVIFNSEGPPAGEGDVEGPMFQAVNDIYADGSAGGAGTVGLRGFLDLYGVLDQLGPDDISRESILGNVRAAVDQPSFWGHPYTCDGEQVAGLPSLCAPQQSLFTVDGPNQNVTINDEWYDTVDLFDRAGVTDHLTYLVLGLGGGAVIAALAIGIVITHRASNVINFAHAAIGMYVAFAYYELRRSGDLVLPVLGLPERVNLVARPTVATALIIAVVLAAAVGAVCFLVIFRPLRSAPPLARVVASLGLMVYLIGVVDLRFEGAAATSLRLDGPLSTHLVDAFGLQVPADRYLLAAISLGAMAVLWVVDRSTRFGLATRAAAENEQGALVLGLSPTSIGLANWMLAAVLAGLAIIAAAPLSGLDPAQTSLLVVPALGAALLGGFRSVVLAGLAGLGIGMLQSEILNLQASSTWLPEVGLQQGVPFVIVVLALVLQGHRLPDRSAIAGSRLPPAPEPRYTMAITGAVVAAGTVALLTLDSSYRLGIIVSAIATVIALSVIVLTGLVGQISLATFALAGTAGFAMVRVTESVGLGFPWAPLVGVVLAVVVGVVAGVPAVRVRGLTLAVTTLAASIAIEELLFRWQWFSGGAEGARVGEPSLFGIDLGIAATGDDYPRVAFGLLTLAAMAGAMVLVVNLRRGATGRRWLAVRANERAAEAAGIPVARVKLGATAVAAALAGLAGVLLAYQAQVVSAGSYGAIESLVAVAITYLAGIATPVAALLAGVLAAGGLLTVVLDGLSEGSSKYQFAVNGLLLMVIAVRYPAGLIGSARRRVRREASA